MVSKGQTKGNGFNFEGAELFIACKLGVNNYMELLDMEEASGSFSKSNLEKGRKSILLFPGVTRAYKDK